MSAATTEARPQFNDPQLHREIMRLRHLDHLTNLAYLFFEYLSLAAVIASVALFRNWRISHNLSWLWDLPILTVAVILIGAIQHRLAGLGHEAAHYSLVRNKFLNDLLADIFCFFPILGTVHFYRIFHLAHHQYTNDPERDPDLVSLGGSKMVDRFPMTRGEFIRSIYLRVLTEPKAFLHYQRDYIDINMLGRAENVYLSRLPGVTDRSIRPWPRLGAILGLIYLAASIAVQWTLTLVLKRPDWLVYQGILGTLLVACVAYALPDRAFFPSPLRQPYSSRFSGVLRLSYFTWFLVALGLLRGVTGNQSSFYFWVLWVLPLLTTFPFFLLLRDVYQHTNADAGRLTNTRVFYPDPFTRWAVFVYGQDMHLPHHLFPAIPHYRLPRLHRLLKERHPDYAASVVECHGTFSNRKGLSTILDTLTRRS